MPATTPGGWPYVLPADHPLEYPAQSQQLATALDAAWIDDPGARRSMTLSAQLSIPTGVATKIAGSWTPSTPTDNGDGVLTYAAGIFTVTTAAVLDISLYGQFGGAAAGRRILSILTDGNTLNSQTVFNTQSSPTELSVAMIGVLCPANTKIQIQAYQDSGAAINLAAARWNLRRVANG